MKIGKHLILIGAMSAALAQSVRAGEEKPGELKDRKEKVSYSVGMTFGNQLKRAGFDVDVDTIAAAIKDVLAGRELKLTDKDAREVMTAYQKELSIKREEERAAKAEKNKKEGEAFLAENKKKEGVKTKTVTLPDGKTAELQYKVLTEGTGPTPKTNDIVSVNFRGTTLNGTEFDSSSKGGSTGPRKYSINAVPKGWSEALQMMKVGSKWQLFVPSALAYGDRGAGTVVEPGATLIYELELVGTEAPPTPPPAQPLTSDIIKVPSAEELKKGAKIEVIKPEEVEKRIKEEQEKEKQKEKKP